LTPALSTDVASESSSTRCAGSRATSSAMSWYSCELVSPFKSPVARTIVVPVGSRCALHERRALLPFCVTLAYLSSPPVCCQTESSRTHRVLISVERPGDVRFAPNPAASGVFAGRSAQQRNIRPHSGTPAKRSPARSCSGEATRVRRHPDSRSSQAVRSWPSCLQSVQPGAPTLRGRPDYGLGSPLPIAILKLGLGGRRAEPVADAMVSGERRWIVRKEPLGHGETVAG
jgi:hypothetical protein